MSEKVCLEMRLSNLLTVSANLGCALVILTMTGSCEPKPGHAPKQPGPQDLVTPVHGLENRVFSFGSRSWSSISNSWR